MRDGGEREACVPRVERGSKLAADVSQRPGCLGGVVPTVEMKENDDVWSRNTTC